VERGNKNMETRKVWNTKKGACITSLPKDWAEGINEVEVFRIRYGTENLDDEALVLTRIDSGASREVEYRVDERINDPDVLEHEILTAYLRGYNKITLNIDPTSDNSFNRLRELQLKLEHLRPTREIGKNVIFIETKAISIPGLLDNMFMRYQENQGKCLNIMKAFSKGDSKKIPELFKTEAEMEFIEDDIDRASFLLKRLLTKLLCLQLDQEELAVDNIADANFLQTIGTNIERLGDLQGQIYDQLEQLSRTLIPKANTRDCFRTADAEEKGSTCSFTDFYINASEMVTDAYSKNSNRMLKVLKTKGKSKMSKELEKQIYFRPGYIEFSQMETILLMVRSHPMLGCLEHIIWGMTGNATNIAEAYYNMEYRKSE